jgi:hypothetical protein
LLVTQGYYAWRDSTVDLQHIRQSLSKYRRSATPLSYCCQAPQSTFHSFYGFHKFLQVEHGFYAAGCLQFAAQTHAARVMEGFWKMWSAETTAHDDRQHRRLIVLIHSLV